MASIFFRDVGFGEELGTPREYSTEINPSPWFSVGKDLKMTFVQSRVIFKSFVDPFYYLFTFDELHF